MAVVINEFEVMPQEPPARASEPQEKAESKDSEKIKRAELERALRLAQERIRRVRAH